ncbi:hypothetical protein [Candidatus Stoquefichus sp. SB1]|uniref:hypothetical protein n=1 Tax=Candidatus Stoquefichus sp. SB1 TaxID=1658109 RepID=UPI0018E2E77D|nr:hypothetical protein [Candidatus Stoquefichus sp. SB1]
MSDDQLHGGLTRRYTASKNTIQLSDEKATIYDEFLIYLESTGLSHSTVKHYSHMSMVFLDYLSQRQIIDISVIYLSAMILSKLFLITVLKQLNRIFVD